MTGLTKKASQVGLELRSLIPVLNAVLADLRLLRDDLREEVTRLSAVKLPQRPAKPSKKRSRRSAPPQGPIVSPAPAPEPAVVVPAAAAAPAVVFTDTRVMTKYGEVTVTALMQRDLRKRHGGDPAAMRAALMAILDQLGRALQAHKGRAAENTLAEAEQYVDGIGGLWDAIEAELDAVSPERTPAREVLYRTTVLEAFSTKRTR